jgi:hypothetical protein
VERRSYARPDRDPGDEVALADRALTTTRGAVRDLFLRALGLVFLAAFLSLVAQVTLLVGERGLLPVGPYLGALGRFWNAPSIFWLGASDHALRLGAVAGAVLSVGLVLDVAPRWCLVACWALYLSFVSIAQDFLSFQWDNLLLETAFFALFVTPGGLRPRQTPPPHPLAVFLMLWLVFRLNVESGAAKLLLGDATWRDLTAVATYYETAPLPTWVGWWAHQLPLAVHKASAVGVYVVEVALPCLLWAPHAVRTVVFVAMVAMQLLFLVTGNYGFFNYLSLALTLWVLDDDHLAWVARKLGRSVVPSPAREPSRARTAALAVAVAVLVPLSLVPFLRFAGLSSPRLLSLQQVLGTWRSLNAYHLFATMTLARREAVIEGSADGETWVAYDFHYKPGDVDRPPPFVAPHQPRVDFQLWFLLLGGGRMPRYFDTLLTRLLNEPDVIAPLFRRNPFPDAPPTYVRVAVYRYRFTDRATRHATGSWWHRELEGHSQTRGARAATGRSRTSAPRRTPAAVAQDEPPAGGVVTGVVRVAEPGVAPVADHLGHDRSHDPRRRVGHHCPGRVEPDQLVERPHRGRDELDAPRLVLDERSARRQPATAHGLRAVDDRLLATREPADEEARVPAPGVHDRRDPAREVEEVVGRGHESRRREHAAERLAGQDAHPQRRQLGRERALEHATRAGGQQDADLLEEFAERGDPVHERIRRAVALAGPRPALLVG